VLPALRWIQISQFAAGLADLLWLRKNLTRESFPLIMMLVIDTGDNAVILILALAANLAAELIRFRIGQLGIARVAGL